MREYPKSVKRLIRKWMIEAYERELHRELTQLDKSFEQWRQGEISSGELSRRIHEYDAGPSRELYKRYNYGSNDLNVAYAIVVGILDEDEVSDELLEGISGALAFYLSLKRRGELKEPDE